MPEQNLEDLLTIKRLAREGVRTMTRPERITKAKELRAQLTEKLLEADEIRTQLKLYSNSYNRREEIDWQDNDRRVDALDKVIEGSGIMRKEIAQYLGVTSTYLSRIFRSKQSPLSLQMEQEIRNSIADLDTERRIRVNKARADKVRKGEPDGSKSDAGETPVA